MLSLFRHPVHRPLVPFGFFDWDDIEPTYYESSSVTQYENNDYVKIQLQKTGGDFKNYKINLEAGADGKKLLKIASQDDKFEKVYEVDPEVVDVENISWKWYKERNLLEVYIPKKKQAKPQPEQGLAEEGKPAETAEAKPIEAARSPSPDKVQKKSRREKQKEKQRKELARLRESLVQLEAEMAKLDEESEAEESEVEPAAEAASQ